MQAQRGKQLDQWATLHGRLRQVRDVLEMDSPTSSVTLPELHPISRTRSISGTVIERVSKAIPP